MNRCQWVVDVHRADALTLAAVGAWYLVFGIGRWNELPITNY